MSKLSFGLLLDPVVWDWWIVGLNGKKIRKASQEEVDLWLALQNKSNCKLPHAGEYEQE